MIERRSATVWGYQAVAAIGGGTIMLAAALLIPHSGIGALFLAGATIIAMAWSVVFATRAFRKSDEFVQERSKVSWYWGSLLGVAASAPLFIFIAMGGLHWLNPASPVGKGLAGAFVLGYSLPVVAQVIGFFAVWTWRRAQQ